MSTFSFQRKDITYKPRDITSFETLGSHPIQIRKTMIETITSNV